MRRNRGKEDKEHVKEDDCRQCEGEEDEKDEGEENGNKNAEYD